MAKPVIDILEAEIEGGRFLYLTALLSGAVIGTANVFWLEMEGKTPELCNVFVAEPARRKGVAQQLISAAQRAIGAPMCLHTVRESPAYWLYRKLGCSEIAPVREKEGSVWMLIPTYA